MKKIVYMLAIGAMMLYACKKTTTDEAATNNTNNPPAGNVAANTFKTDSTTIVTTTQTTNQGSGFVSVIFPYTSPGAGYNRIGLFFKTLPAVSGTYKVRSVYPASNLAANEVEIDLNYYGCNYVSDSATATVTVNGANINIQFAGVPCHFNNYAVSSGYVVTQPGKFSGNLNFK